MGDKCGSKRHGHPSLGRALQQSRHQEAGGNAATTSISAWTQSKVRS